MGVTPYNTLVFTSTEAIKNELTSRTDMSDEQKSFIAGSASGALALVIYNPVELLKVRAQVNRVESIKYFRATMALLRNEGFIGGVYKGMLALLLRDVPGWGVYFWSYEFLKRQFGMGEAKRNGTDNTKLNIMIKMWCAGVAGQCSWFVSYPMDIVKTQIQCTADRRVPMREVIVRIHQSEGI